MANCYPTTASQGSSLIPIKWSSIASWTPSVPTIGDDVYLNGCYIEIDQNIKIGTIRNTALAGTTTGGALPFGYSVGNNNYISKTGTITISTINTTSSITTYSSASNRSLGVQGAGVFWKCTDATFMSTLVAGDYIRDASGLNPVRVIQIDDLLNGYFQVDISKNYNTVSGLKYDKNITGSGTLFTQELLPNVILKDNSGSFNIIGEINSIGNDTILTLVDNPYGSLSSPGQLGSGLTLKAPVSIYFSGGNPDADGCNIINGGSGVTAIGTVNPLIYPLNPNSNIVYVRGKVKGGSASNYHGISLSAGTTNRTGNSVFLDGGAIGGAVGTGIQNNNAASINNNVYISGTAKGGAGSSAYGVNIAQNSTINVLRGNILDVQGGSVGTDAYGILVATLSTFNATTGTLSTSAVNFNSSYGIFAQNSANINLTNPILNSGNYSVIIGSTSTGQISISGGTITNSATNQVILNCPKISLTDSVLVYNPGVALPWKTWGTTNTITPADVWNYALVNITTGGTIGKLIKDDLNLDINTVNTNVIAAQGVLTTTNTNVGGAQAVIGTVNTNVSSLQSVTGTINTNLTSAQQVLGNVQSVTLSTQGTVLSIQSTGEINQTNILGAQSVLTTTNSNVISAQTVLTDVNTNVNSVQQVTGNIQQVTLSTQAVVDSIQAVTGTPQDIANQVWSDFDTNPNNSPYIQRVHNVSTVDTTGQQISTI